MKRQNDPILCLRINTDRPIIRQNDCFIERLLLTRRANKINSANDSNLGRPSEDDPGQQPADLFADLEATLDQVAEENPRIAASDNDQIGGIGDLRALLEASLVVNSSLVLDDVLEIVMRKAIELMQAERGLIMLLDDDGRLQTRSAYNLVEEEMLDDEFRISSSIARQVAKTGKSVYTSDAIADERYAQQQSVVELHLRSIMSVPIKYKDQLVGVIYLDNSTEARSFLKSDLYILELYAQMVANALHNAAVHDSLVTMKLYSESVVANTPVGIVVIDAYLHLATINIEAAEIFEFNVGDVRLVGSDPDPTSFMEIIPESEQPRWANMITTTIATGTEYSDTRYFHNTGHTEKALSLKISPVSHLPNGDDGLMMTIEDITEKVIMEKYVILSEKLVAKGEMAASIAHELNNYLAIASNNAELLTMNIGRKQFDKVKFNSKSIVDNIFKIKRFVDNLMDFSRPDTEYISYDIKHLIEDLLFSIRVQPRFKQIQFTVDLGDKSPNLEMDVGQIQQVFINLLNNAADAIKEKGSQADKGGPDTKPEISIIASYDVATEKVTVDVSDGGIGMNEDTLKKIFSLHFTTKKGGHGLGLANCRKIMEQHNGELTVESTLGKGTTFRVVLPRFHTGTSAIPK